MTVEGPVESIVRAVHAGTRTAREVVEGYLETALARNPDLNAFTELDPDGALRQADRVDAGPRTGPLDGVPIALKDLIDHAGHVTTAGSGFYRKEPAVSAPVVDRLEAAGAIIMGRTGLHEFAYGFSSENPWFGVVRNPWDRNQSPGGSSGGSAAAVAARMAPAAIGTDTGGSVRTPAALCGVVGLKVTHGRVPLTGVFPLAGSMDTVGPLATTSGDCRILYRAMKGFDRSDPWSTPADTAPERLGSLEGLRTAVPVAWLDRGADLGGDPPLLRDLLRPAARSPHQSGAGGGTVSGAGADPGQAGRHGGRGRAPPLVRRSHQALRDRPAGTPGTRHAHHHRRVHRGATLASPCRPGGQRDLQRLRPDPDSDCGPLPGSASVWTTSGSEKRPSSIATFWPATPRWSTYWAARPYPSPSGTRGYHRRPRSWSPPGAGRSCCSTSGRLWRERVWRSRSHRRRDRFPQARIRGMRIDPSTGVRRHG